MKHFVRICLLLLASLAIVLAIRNRVDVTAPSPEPEPAASGETPTPKTTSPESLPTPAPTRVPVARGQFELPVEGATGFATVEMNLRAEPTSSSKLLQKVKSGAAFRILQEKGEYWRVESDAFSGYLAHKYCMIQLPDVIPSIIYENTNASASRVTSSGKQVPGISGQPLYTSRAFDERLGREVFIMPVLYSTAKKICAAQQAALRDGNALKIYEAYRPRSAQREMVGALSALAERDAEVRAGISAPLWKMSWFISQGRSNHQCGLAMDASLVRVQSMEVRHSGGRAYNHVSAYEEYEMPSPIHELSVASVAFDAPVLSTSATAWRSAAPAKAMNAPALLLQGYCADAGLTPLASEWWHFTDLESDAALGENKGQGLTVLGELYSVEPN